MSRPARRAAAWDSLLEMPHRPQEQSLAASHGDRRTTGGGGRKVVGVWSGYELASKVLERYICNTDYNYRSVAHIAGGEVGMEVDGCIAAHLTLSDLSMNIPKNDVIEYAGRHGLYLSTRTCVKDIQDAILFHESKKHKCCTEGITFFRPCHTLERSKALHSEVHNMPGFKENTSSHSRTSYEFPPPPPSDTLKRRIVEDFCREMSPDNLIEEGCAVCGCLSRTKDMKTIKPDLFDMKLLEDRSHRVTRRERTSTSDPIRPISGPVLDKKCTRVCSTCLKDLKRNKVPKLALVNGNWVGDVPPELQGLTFLEQMLIGRLRHNACVLKVHASGQYKMKSNAVMFSVPMPKVYKVLPPPREEFEEIVAFIFIGPTRPTDDMHARLPSFIRRSKVMNALDWLKFNHEEYIDFEISYNNLQ